MSQKIARGVYMVGGMGLSADGDASVYLVTGEDEAVLIDAGTGNGTDAVIQNIERAGVDPASVKHLILTHCHVDHSGGAPDLQSRLKVKTIAHANCARILAIGDDTRTAARWYGMRLPPIIVDAAFEGDEYRLPIGGGELCCLFTPGHSPGSISIYLDRDGERILFGQDVHGPIHPALESNERQWQASLRLLLELKADVLCEGHFGVYRPRSEVEKYIRSFLEDED